jgi:hypothetical protein
LASELQSQSELQVATLDAITLVDGDRVSVLGVGCAVIQVVVAVIEEVVGLATQLQLEALGQENRVWMESIKLV